MKSELSQHYITQFNDLVQKMKPEASEIKAIREQAYHQFLDEGFPSVKIEGWQHTDLSKLRQIPFSVWNNHHLLPKNIDSNPLPINFPYHIYIEDGEILYKNLPEGITLSPITKVQDKSLLNDDSHSDHDFISTMNHAFFTHSFFLQAAPNLEKLEPIYILHKSRIQKNNYMTNCKMVVEVGSGSELSLIEHHLSSHSFRIFHNFSSRIKILKNGRMNHTIIQELGPETLHFSSPDYFLESDARLNASYFSMSGKLIRNHSQIVLSESGAHGDISGLALGRNQQSIDNFTVIKHQAPHTSSRELFKYILDEKSTGVFTGKIIVDEGAVKTDSKQSNRNLLLSKSAAMNSNPQLEIYSDDVKCGHGSSTGELDEDAIFYLRSRGINHTQALALLVSGFGGEIISRILPDISRKYVKTKFEKWLKN